MAAPTEEDYTTALAHLATLQPLIDDLRDTIPSIVRPLGGLARATAPDATGQAPAAADVYAARKAAILAIKAAATRGTEGVATLKTEWQSERTGEVLKMGR